MDDFNQVVQSYITVFSAEPWNDVLTTSQIEQYVTNISELNTFIGYILEDTDSHSLVGIALGFIKPWYQGKEYLVDTFLIEKEYQSIGIGTKFLSQIKADLQTHGIPTLVLDTDKGMPVEFFYLKNGFKALEGSLTLYASTNQ